ncbi:MAG: Ribosomal protein methyltransferase [Pseudomonadota bacterium]|nr:Ribosomal protein methyltransferase [Pseudomonadota bacterium]
MSFKQIIINIDSQRAEQLSDIFFDLGALSVSIEDEHEGTELEQPIFNEPGMIVEALWEHSKVVVLFDDLADVASLVSAAEIELNAAFSYVQENVDDQDWVRLTQSQFEPIEVTPNLYIVPSWHSIPDAEATGIILDPGLAFGTGSHPTTFMCLRWIAENITPELEVLDYGCGSGILAITAKKVGAKLVDGVDIDSQAIESSLYNAEVNQVRVNFCLPNQFLAKQYDVVIANILSNPLRMLASALASYVKPSGQIILSGILESQIEEMCEIYAQWFVMSTYTIQEGWACLHGVKK